MAISQLVVPAAHSPSVTLKLRLASASLAEPPYRERVSTSVSQPGAVIMTPGEFDTRFTGLFEHEAFRLELLDRYDSPGTQERVQRFLAGQPDDPAVRGGWDAVITEAREAAKVMSRVHVVAEPLTDYLRFELDFYRGSVAAGEDVRILPMAAAAGLDLPGFDFWLFDRSAAVMVYDQAGWWQRTELVTSPGFVASCRRWRDTAISHALPLADYTARRTT